MILSHTQLAGYLRCPRSYRYRYLDGWRDKETRAAMVFGRCFEKALAALFRQEDPGATLFQEWGFRGLAEQVRQQAREARGARSEEREDLPFNPPSSNLDPPSSPP